MARKIIFMKRILLTQLTCILVLFSLVGCGHVSNAKTEMTMEERLLSGYWYLNLFEVAQCFMKLHFNENGTCEGIVLSKYDTIEQNSGLEWEYNSESEELYLYMPSISDELEMKFYYDTANNRFQMDYEVEYWPSKEEIPEDCSGFYQDGMNIHLFTFEHSYESLGAEEFNNLMTAIYGYDNYSEIYNKIVDNVEKSKVQSDKFVIDELYHEILYTMVYTDEDVKVNPKPVKVTNNGNIFIADLFDTSNSAGQNFSTEMEDVLGDTIEFKSRMKNDCTIQIVEFDLDEGTLVIQVISEDAEMKYYLNSSGEHEGVYIADEQTENNTPDTVVIPELRGDTQSVATEKLEKQDLKITYVFVPTKDNALWGTIKDTEPIAGTEVKQGSEIKIYVYMSQEPDVGTVPIISGKTVDDARKELSDAGFEDVTCVYEAHDDIDKNYVIGISGAQMGEEVPLTTLITLIVSKGK